MEQTILVTGATGAQGGAVVRLLASKGLKVKALITESDDTAWFAANRVATVVGNFNDEASLVHALQGVTHVSLVYPLIYDWALLRQYTTHLIGALKQSSVQHIVFNTSLPLPPQKTGSMAADIKLEILERFIENGLPVTTISPSFYLDNLTAPWSLPVIQEQGIISYPLPADAPFAWLSHYNLAQYTYKVLVQPQLIGKIFPIGGALLTGNEIAAQISRFIQKPVQYSYLPPAGFKTFLLQQYSDEVASEIAGIYEHIASNTEPFKAFYNEEHIKNVFGIQLQSIDEWMQTIAWN